MSALRRFMGEKSQLQGHQATYQGIRVMERPPAFPRVRHAVGFPGEGRMVAKLGPGFPVRAFPWNQST